jgi:hypothetical protein
MILTDLNNYIKPSLLSYKDLIVAGSGTDDTKVTNTDGVDVQGFSSAQLAIAWNGVLTDEKTLKLTVEVSESDDDSTYSTPVELLEQVQATAETPTTDYSGVKLINFDLSGYKRYLKIGITLDLNASGTDTASWHAVLILGGAQELPTEQG